MYTDKTKVQLYLGSDIGSELNTQITAYITAVSNWIDRYTGKKFIAVSETRYYPVENKTNDLLIDSFIKGSIDSIVVKNISDNATIETLSTSDYYAYPYNDTEQNRIIRRTGNFDSDSMVEVTADFGATATCPQEIELVASKLVAKILEKAIDGGKVSKKKVQDIEFTYEQIEEEAEALGVYQILDLWRDYNI